MGLWRTENILHYVKTHKMHLRYVVTRKSMTFGDTLKLSFFRPKTSLGLWLIFLFPLTLIVSVGVHSVISTATYKLASIFSFGLICSSILLLKRFSRNGKTFKDDIFMFLTFVSVSALFIICLHRGTY